MFFFFTLTNIQSQQYTLTEINLHRKYIQIYPINNIYLFYSTKDYNEENLFKNHYYLPLSLFRLLNINLLYIVSMKILLLTTIFQDIISFFLTILTSIKS